MASVLARPKNKLATATLADREIVRRHDGGHRLPAATRRPDNAPMSRRLQFSLRTLLVVTAVVAGPFAWVAHIGIIVSQRKAMREVFPTGKSSFYEEWCVPHREQSLPWLRRVFGDEPVNALHYIPDRDPDGSELRRVRSLFPESEIFGQPK